MAKYTTEVRSICENLAGYDASKGYQSVQEIIENSRSKIFSFNYPMFDPEYKPVLETKILKHYYGREIGSETFGRWQLWLDTKLNEIMPFYNKLYESELLEFNPFYDVDLTTNRKTDGEKNATGTKTDEGTVSNELVSQDSGSNTISKTSQDGGTETNSRSIVEGGTERLNGSKTFGGSDGKSTSTTDSGTQSDSGSDVNKNTRWDIFSDTPQGTLTDVDEEEYLTNARKITDDGTGSTHSNTTTFGKTVTGSETDTYGKTETDVDTTTFGKTIGDNNTTTFGKTIGSSETDAFGKKNTTNEDGEHSNIEHTTDNITTTEDYLQHVFGKSGGVSYAKLLMEYRETFLNIDMLVINDLSDLFMGLW